MIIKNKKFIVQTNSDFAQDALLSPIHNDFYNEKVITRSYFTIKKSYYEDNKDVFYVLGIDYSLNWFWSFQQHSQIKNMGL